ncbi:MAG: SEL1-like repeat protein, partial [Desulfovibrionaceae bacterium]|nr:SEL1-like repeat protein [Desulfovibrionaceae bacterium]
KAIHYLELGRKHEDPECFHNLGYLALKGLGMPKDQKKAFDYFLEGAMLGNINCFKDIIKCYQYGWGVEPDPELVVIWERKMKQAIDFKLEQDLLNGFSSGKH